MDMVYNNVEMDLNMRLIESGLTQTAAAGKAGVTLSYVNPITKGRDRTVVKMMDELGCGIGPVQEKRQHSSIILTQFEAHCRAGHGNSSMGGVQTRCRLG
jgi:hypothetical protein